MTTPVCPKCGATESRRSLDKPPTDLEGLAVALEKAPMFVCAQCGERFEHAGTHDGLTPKAMDVRYARGKFREAVHEMARSEGALRERVVRACRHCLHVVGEKDMPIGQTLDAWRRLEVRLKTVESLDDDDIQAAASLICDLDTHLEAEASMLTMRHDARDQEP